jgi:hypothetical protein
MCKAKWPARRRPTEGERATPERAATRDPEPRTRRLRCRNRTRLRPCASASWPAQGRSPEAKQAAPKRAATHGPDGAPPREEGIASPRGPGARIKGAGDVAARCEDGPAHTQSVPRHQGNGTHSPSNPMPPVQWLILGISSLRSRERGGASGRHRGRQGSTLQWCHALTHSLCTGWQKGRMDWGWSGQRIGECLRARENSPESG